MAYNALSPSTVASRRFTLTVVMVIRDVSPLTTSPRMIIPVLDGFGEIRTFSRFPSLPAEDFGV